MQAATQHPSTAAHDRVLGSPRDAAHMPDDDTQAPSLDHIRASRLVYAKPQDLPSFPSVGLQKNGAAASAAATLGWANQKSPELWKPDSSASASAAAVLAKNYKMAPTWEPQASNHGAKAALLAAQGAKTTDAWKPSATAHGQSAATMAFNSNSNANANASVPRHMQQDAMQRHGSLHAAQGAMTSRQRAISTPAPRPDYPDEANAASNALAAATHAHKPGRAQPTATPVGGAVPYTTMNRLMFTSNPPVKTETEDQNRADVLHASAIAMAKKMYTQQQKTMEERIAKAETSSFKDGESDDEQPMVFNNLQEAAYKQAQARLAKIHEDNKKLRGTRDSQEYYGVSSSSRRGTIRDRLRRRASSDGALTEDNLRSQQIRHEMSIFSKTLQTVDDKKRQRDQEALLAAAHRNVQARLKGMDDKISAETGMVQPSTNWEHKAHAAALLRSTSRADRDHGKVDVGAGLKMDQDAIDAIAARRVQPVLDEINEKAEKEHARQTALRLEEERKKEEQELEKTRQKEISDINKKLKEQEKQEQRERKAEEKQEAKAKKEEERARKEEERAAKNEKKRLSRIEKHQETTAAAGQEDVETDAPRTSITLNSSGQPVSVPNSQTREATTPEGDQSPESPKSGSEKRGRVRSWIKSRFAKNDSKSADRNSKGFVGGAALTGMEGNESTVSLDNRSASMHAVAMAGRSQTDHNIEDDDEPVSPLSSSSEEEVFRDAPSEPLTGLTPPRPLREERTSLSHSPDRASKFRENI
ncbi:hypothetical protein Micbo1qcDRAFT_161091 [Microdochium bolleyi]|uniref:Eisosome protein 1 n=1 Tax=Microdochium bolleyi TaxID=196109 RepID=A0A136J7N4_9PEZI|nr:hypothetical protein Micbo1qcDRAFT_161091 [Microdochium bolleyi]